MNQIYITDKQGTKVLPITHINAVRDSNGNPLSSLLPQTMGASGSNHSGGLVPDPGITAGTSKYLREDGTWQTPPTNTYVFNTAYDASTNKAATMADIPSTLPASDVSSWAKQSSKPSYNYSEIGYTATAVNGSGALTLAGTDPIYVVTVTGNISSVALTANPSAGHSCHVFFVTDSSDSTNRTVTIAHDSTNRICPKGEDLLLTVPKNAGGYIEVDFLNANNKVYVRGI